MTEGLEPPTVVPPSLVMVDHLVLAVPDLDAAIESLDALLGVRAAPGGRHPVEATRNALIALGPETYLEILGPDAGEPAPGKHRWLRVDEVREPRLTAWAARTLDPDGVFTEAAAGGIRLGAVLSGSRSRPDGTVVSWRFTDPHVVVWDGIVPFFIDWGTTPHPSRTAARGASLVSLRVEHPEPDAVRSALERLGLALPVTPGRSPALIATIRCPKGVVELR